MAAHPGSFTCPLCGDTVPVPMKTSKDGLDDQVNVVLDMTEFTAHLNVHARRENLGIDTFIDWSVMQPDSVPIGVGLP